MSKAREFIEWFANNVVEDYDQENIKQFICEYNELEQKNKELMELMSEIANYLNRNKLNYIGSGSIFNQQINELLNKYKDGN